ncbi:alpha/beta hydrolase fold domain-containing protein [Rhizobium mesoamericanum]|uniref:alpha/beta hydrolase fold domain-containing protein n=1 Tax=Rhizobium mesoamericanum TaxID=1079800 RepID=UPI000684DD10|nr:alpha/beta hydrolase fold domain-containing protein [Rhizobium mesoamericanum]
MTLHITSASSNPVLDTLTQEFLDRYSGPAKSINELRGRLHDVQEDCDIPLAGIYDLDFPHEEYRVNGRLMLPTGVAPPYPVLLFYCSSGRREKGPLNGERLCRDLAEGGDVAVLCVDVSEGDLRARVEVAFRALCGVIDISQSIGLDATRIAVAGDGIGGNVAASLCMIARDRAGPAISLQILFNPALSDEFDTLSYQSFAQGPWMTEELMSQFFDELAPSTSARVPLPKDVSVRNLEGMPPALIMTAENDVARDEGEAYARKLMQAGVRVSAVRFLGTIHDFAVLDPLADTPAAQGAVFHAVAVLKSTFAE